MISAVVVIGVFSAVVAFDLLLLQLNAAGVCDIVVVFLFLVEEGRRLVAAVAFVDFLISAACADCSKRIVLFLLYRGVVGNGDDFLSSSTSNNKLLVLPFFLVSVKFRLGMTFLSHIILRMAKRQEITLCILFPSSRSTVWNKSDWGIWS